MGHRQLTCTFIAIVRERWCWEHHSSSSRCPSCSDLCLRYKALNPFLGQNRNAGKDPATRSIYAVEIATHDEGKPQFDRFVVGLSYDDMTTWVCGDYRLKCNVSPPIFMVLFLYSYHMFCVTALSHYHGLPTSTATAIEYMLSRLLREHQNDYPLVPLTHLEHVSWSDI
jgi:hypothetical protein